MSDSETEQKSAQLEPELRDMKIEEGAPRPTAGEGAAAVSTRVKAEDDDDDDEHLSRTLTPLTLPPRTKSRSTTHSPVKLERSTASTPASDEQEEVLGGEITLMAEPGKAPKLARTALRKVIARPPPLYLDLPDVTENAKDTFVVLPECTYGNKGMGTTEPALECECSEEWDPIAKQNDACGPDSDCINRATKMECARDCGCGNSCQNQRFLRKQYADVTVIKTEKKGFGLRTNVDLSPEDFVFEYIGEVIDERSFRKRMMQYDEEGIKHFYFMSLTKGEFVDATKKGNLGRFCNHSCNPNCYVDKWVVGDKLRMGIFAERKIKAGEELVFNYNVDRYGADPQPCYCGEPNCTGFIGGRTQTDNATKLSHATIEALGIDDGDGWDTAVARKPRKKKKTEDDEEYVNDIQPKSLEVAGVTKVMAALRQCTEKWIAVKLLSRIQQSDDEKVGHRIIQMHGYNILRTTLATWKGDVNVVLQVLDILERLPRITRNKIQDSNIEEVVGELKNNEDERVATEASELLDAWSQLEVAYRIPRMKRDPNAGTPARTQNHFERRERGRGRSRSRSKSPAIAAPKGPANIPSGPRALNAPRGPAAFNAPRGPQRPRPPPFNPLPQGWFEARSDNGSVYYYTHGGTTQWQRPTQPAVSQAPPPPPKAKTNEQLLQDIISKITSNTTPSNRPSASTTPQPTSDKPKNDKKSKSDKWKSLPQEKQEKLYESTLAPHVMSVVSHYKKKFEKDDLKRLSKEVAKKLVRGDYRANRVQDPTAKLSSKHEKNIKKYVKEFMEKAVEKKAERDKLKAAKAEQKVGGETAAEMSDTPKLEVEAKEEDSDDDMGGLSDHEEPQSHDVSPADSSTIDLKRQREEDGDIRSPKKSRVETPIAPPPPPPPPPPPLEDMPLDDSSLTPSEDISPPFGLDAANGVNGVTSSGLSTELVADRVKSEHPSRGSPMQLATPDTTTNGSCEHDTTNNDGVSQLDGTGDTRPVASISSGRW
ncbi:hypothetical protein BDV96DRAFT_596729 [Lophiotrema nucula]|uniref:Histone-lysine N-methyltransferase, H3 lysine-36 specific n=1 Tax=Lophiotrema nucula TaxID=690887 RepID=A0A6A5ZJA7_9PLEO|nr:hypothetical protein BDV96DRAFT_596729 [Lophiotrema nucula]